MNKEKKENLPTKGIHLSEADTKLFLSHLNNDYEIEPPTERFIKAVNRYNKLFSKSK